MATEQPRRKREVIDVLVSFLIILMTFGFAVFLVVEVRGCNEKRYELEYRDRMPANFDKMTDAEKKLFFPSWPFAQ